MNTPLSHKPSFLVVAPIFIYLTTCSMYVMPSGLPQIFDIIAVVGVLFCFNKAINFSYANHHSLFTISILFLSWVVFVSTLNALYHQEIKILIAPFYYIYNLLLLMYVLYALSDKRNLKIAIYCMCTLVIAMFIFQGVLSSGETRETLKFNNPNQLAYFSLVYLSIFSMCFLKHKQLKLNRVFLMLSMLACVWFTALSLSITAVVASIITITILTAITLKNNKSATLMIGSVIFVMFFTLPILVKSFPDGYLESVSARIERSSQKTADIKEERHYDRIVKYYEQTLIGAGEGANERFGHPQEIHSTFGTLFFSYGIVGLSIFFIILKVIYNKVGFFNSLFLVPILLYSITHQGLRSSVFWLLLGFIILILTLDEDEE